MACTPGTVSLFDSRVKFAFPQETWLSYGIALSGRALQDRGNPALSAIQRSWPHFLTLAHGDSLPIPMGFYEDPFFMSS